MSLPTSGYTANRIDYTVAVDGSSFTFTISVNATQLGGSAAEEVIAILEPALLDLASDLESLTGATDGHVYKAIYGSTPNDDIA